jgi:transcriptional regulator with XRE-family HTH domain
MTEALAAAGYDTSLSAIGRLFDVWPSAVAKWRDGVASPELGKLLELSDLTNCSLEWLLTGVGTRTRTANVDQLTRELLELWGLLDEQARKQLVDFAKFKAPPDQDSPAKPAGG